MYGSDALAGVVNFVMRKDFEGIEVDGQYNIAEADNTNAYYRGLVTHCGLPARRRKASGTAQNVTGTLIMGTNTANGKGNVTAYMSYQNTSAVLAGARDFSACTIGGTSHHACAGSSNYNRFFSLDDSAATTRRGASATPYDFFETGHGPCRQRQLRAVHRREQSKVQLRRAELPAAPRHALCRRLLRALRSEQGTRRLCDRSCSRTTTRWRRSLRRVSSSAPAPSARAFVEINCNNPLLTGNEASSLCGIQCTWPVDYYRAASTPAAVRNGVRSPIPFGTRRQSGCAPVGNDRQL